MSGTLKVGTSGLIFDIHQDKAKKFCTDKYGPEWDLDVREIKIMNVPYYLGRCVHKSYNGTDSFCCDNFLLKNEVFGPAGAAGNSQTTCRSDTNNILTCNKINRKDICYNQILAGSPDNLCGTYISTPGNNLELITNELVDLFTKDYNGVYNKYKSFMATYSQLKIVQNLDKIIRDNYEITKAKNDIKILTEQVNQKIKELSIKETELNTMRVSVDAKQKELVDKNNIIVARDEELLKKQAELTAKQKEMDNLSAKLNTMSADLVTKQSQLTDRINMLNAKESDLVNIKNALTLKEADFNKISGAISALEQQNKEMQDSLVQKNALIDSVNANIKETEAKLQNYITQRDALNKELNDTKEKTDKEIKLAQENYKAQLAKLAQDEKDARAKLESALAEQKKKDMEELTKVYQSREAELQKNFVALKEAQAKVEEENKIQAKKLMDDLEKQKAISEQTIKNYNQQMLDKQKELDVIKKQKDDEILKIQKESSNYIAKVRADNEKASADLIKKFEEEKAKSLKEITDVFNEREKQISNKLNEIQAQLLKAEQDNKLKIQAMMDEYEKKKTDYEKTLLDEYKKKDADYKKMADQREKQYQDALVKLQADNEAQSKKLNEQYQKELADINNQKAQMQAQFDEFKKKSEADFALLTIKLNEERSTYNKEISRLNDLVKAKEEEAKKKLLDIQMSLQNDLKSLEATQNLKKDLLFEQTNKQIAQALEELNTKKSDINKEFEEELRIKQADLDKSIAAQKQDYVNKINVLQESNNKLVSNLELLGKNYQIAQDEQQTRLKTLIDDKQKEYVKIQEEYVTKAKNEQAQFEQLVKKLEEQKLATIKNFTGETEKELSRLNIVLEEQKAKNQVEADQKRKELVETITKLEDEKIKLVQQKNTETKQALDKIQQMYDTQAGEIKAKLEEFNKLKSDYDKKIKDEMVLFENQMRKIEEEKIQKVGEYTKFTQQEMDFLGKNLEEQRLKAETDGIKYRKALEETIEKLDKERMEIIKKKNDETAEILNKIKQEYDKEVESVNASIKEYNDKKKEYDTNIKLIDEEQTTYVAKKRAEAEAELGKLSKMLTDEIDALKNKIEDYKVQREVKLKEINELNVQLEKLQKQYEIDQQRTTLINKSVLFGSIGLIVILLGIIYYLKTSRVK